MSFDLNEFAKVFSARLQNSFGLQPTVADVFAKAAAQELTKAWGGSRHYIPSRSIDREGIRADRDRGVSIAKICRRHSVSLSTVHRILKGAK